MGTVTGIVLKQNNILNAILVKFDNDKIGCDAKCNSKYKHIDTDSVPIVKIEVSFSVHKNHVRVSSSDVMTSRTSQLVDYFGGSQQ